MLSAEENTRFRVSQRTISSVEGISRDEASALWCSADSASLMRAACLRRETFHGRTVTFSRKVFIPLTRLCRDYCGYCTFRRDPGQEDARFLTPDEVLRIAEKGRRAGCKEALFSLGDQPEKQFPEARAELLALGVERTLEYLAEMCELVLRETGLLPHANPGVMGRSDLARLKICNASMGLMLESTSTRLFAPGAAHFRAPDKVPALRLRTIEDAGRAQIAFTTGILIGIGETIEDRIDSLLKIRSLHRQYGHIQEVIVQNFRAKPGIPMESAAEPSIEDMLRTISVARLILDGEMNLQAPPNLSYSDFPSLLDAGINDWGGISPVTRDWINPEAAWPALDLLSTETQRASLRLRERAAIYPEFAHRPEFIHPNVLPRLKDSVDEEGYARN
jgi:FO synthase